MCNRVSQLKIEDNTTYIYFTEPKKPNNFQNTIQFMQKILGLTNWKTTHVFASCGKKLINRTGSHTVLKEFKNKDGIIEYVKTTYNNHNIKIYSLNNVNANSNFDSLYNHINKNKDYSFEDLETGEVYGYTQYKPNNTLYGMGSETLITGYELLSYICSGRKIDEDKVLGDMKPLTVEPKDNNTLKNPTYCSLVLGELIPEIKDKLFTRYPSLTQSYVEKAPSYKLFWESST